MTISLSPAAAQCVCLLLVLTGWLGGGRRWLVLLCVWVYACV
jgi:hypothetical protein